MRNVNRIVTTGVMVVVVIAGALLAMKLTVLSPAAEKTGEYLLDRASCKEAELRSYGAADIRVAFSTGGCDVVANDAGHASLSAVSGFYSRLRRFGFPRLNTGTILLLNPNRKTEVIGTAGYARVGIMNFEDPSRNVFETGRAVALLMISRAAPGLDARDADDLAQAVAWLARPSAAQWKHVRLSDGGRQLVRLISRGGWEPVRYALSNCGQQCSLLS